MTEDIIINEENKIVNNEELDNEAMKPISTFIEELRNLYISIPYTSDKIEMLKERLNLEKDTTIDKLATECGFSESQIKEIIDIWKEVSIKWMYEYNEKINYANKGIFPIEDNDKEIAFLKTETINYYRNFFDEIRGRKREDGEKDSRFVKLIEKYENTLVDIEKKRRMIHRYNGLAHFGDAWWIKTEKECGFSIDEIIDIEEEREKHIIRKLREHKYFKDIENRYRQLISNVELTKFTELSNMALELQDLSTKMKLHNLLKPEDKKLNPETNFNML